jgi:hypothetical protein
MQPITLETRVRSCETFGGQRSIGIRFIRISRNSPVTIIPPMLHNIRMHVALTKRTNGQSLGTLQNKQRYFGNGGALDRKVQ